MRKRSGESDEGQASTTGEKYAGTFSDQFPTNDEIGGRLVSVESLRSNSAG